MKETFFPPAFIAKYKRFCGVEWDVFFQTIKTKQPKSFWVNTNKIGVGALTNSLRQKGVKFENYAFSKQSFSIDATKPGDFEEYKKGWMSLQEKAAMMPVVALGVDKKDYVLDCCAAPGMKTIQLSNFGGKVVACEVNTKRVQALEKTKMAFALRNVDIRRTDFRNVKEKFDKVLLDAPCSSEGLVRKRKEALDDWTQNLVTRKAKLQKSLIISAFDALRPGGEMVYATCSFAVEENEEVVNFLLQLREGAIVVPVKLDGVKVRENKLCPNAVRLWPQDNDTQQFFFAKIRKG